MVNQTDSRWKDLSINGTPYKFGSYGCFISCVCYIAGIEPPEGLKKLKFDGANLIFDSITNIGLEPLEKINYAKDGSTWDNAKALKYIKENGQCIARVDFDGSERTDDTHFVILIGNKKLLDPIDGKEKPTSTYSKYTGIRACRKMIMADTVQLDKETFQKLVTKATQLDALVAEGVSQPADIQKIKDISNEYRTQKEKAEQEAKACREESTIFKQEVAGKLNSTQDLPRILGAIDEIINTIDQMTVRLRKADDDVRQYETQVTELKAEIKRLELLLKSNNSLSQATMYDMLLELFNRLVKILRRY